MPISCWTPECGPRSSSSCSASCDMCPYGEFDRRTGSTNWELFVTEFLTTASRWGSARNSWLWTSSDYIGQRKSSARARVNDLGQLLANLTVADELLLRASRLGSDSANADRIQWLISQNIDWERLFLKAERHRV